MSDTTKKYIKMCEKAKKLQKFFKIVDYAKQGYCTQHKCLIVSGMDGGEECPGFFKKYASPGRPLTKAEQKKFGFVSPEDCEWDKKWINLFSQEDLQEIWFKHIKCTNKRSQVFRLVVELFSAYNSGYIKLQSSIEQFLLVFVMKAVCGKVWNGEDWVKGK